MESLGIRGIRRNPLRKLTESEESVRTPQEAHGIQRIRRNPLRNLQDEGNPRRNSRFSTFQTEATQDVPGNPEESSGDLRKLKKIPEEPGNLKNHHQKSLEISKSFQDSLRIFTSFLDSLGIFRNPKNPYVRNPYVSNPQDEGNPRRNSRFPTFQREATRDETPDFRLFRRRQPKTERQISNFAHKGPRDGTPDFQPCTSRISPTWHKAGLQISNYRVGLRKRTIT